MLKAIDHILKEYFDFSENNLEKEYIRKINDKYNNLIAKAEVHNNFSFLLAKNINNLECGQENKCETNSFDFVKQKMENGEDYYYPVGGYYFWFSSFTPIEHWWIYDAKNKKHLEISPLGANKKNIMCYAGIINYSIQKDISKAKSPFEIDFFKGGHVHNNYFK